MESYKLSPATINLFKQLYLKVYFLSKLTPANFNTYFNDSVKNKALFR